MLNFFIEYGPMIYFGACAFAFGACLGSLMNVIVARLPYEKSIFWPGSRCFKCLQSVRLYDNIPLVSYWILGGRCRICKAPFSVRYFLIELFVALAFVGLFAGEIIRNVNHIPGLERADRDLTFRFVSLSNVPYFLFFLHRATLVWLLIAAALCDLEDRTIPFSITMIGTIIGLVFAVCLPWPWPSTIAQAMPPPDQNDWWVLGPKQMQKTALYLWPVWKPPVWAPAGSWQLGLLTGLAGAATGTFLLRGVKFLAERGLGKEALGLGDADLMMMVGAFLGWQPVVVAFLLGAVITLIFSLPSVLLRSQKPLPFGPGLAAGTVVTVLGWQTIGPAAHLLLFKKEFILLFLGGSAVLTFVMLFLFGRFQPPAAASPGE